MSSLQTMFMGPKMNGRVSMVVNERINCLKTIARKGVLIQNQVTWIIRYILCRIKNYLYDNLLRISNVEVIIWVSMHQEKLLI